MQQGITPDQVEQLRAMSHDQLQALLNGGAGPLYQVFGPAAGLVTGLLWIIAVLVVGLTVFNMVFMPRYKVWRSHMEGLADLAQAKNEQLVQVAQAEGRLAAAEKNKAAAIVEAAAVRAQIDTIGEGLQHHDLYLRWQWISMMEKLDTKQSVIYVPTEANLPILEAGRR